MAKQKINSIIAKTLALKVERDIMAARSDAAKMVKASIERSADFKEMKALGKQIQERRTKIEAVKKRIVEKFGSHGITIRLYESDNVTVVPTGNGVPSRIDLADEIYTESMLTEKSVADVCREATNKYAHKIVKQNSKI